MRPEREIYCFFSFSVNVLNLLFKEVKVVAFIEEDPPIGL